MIPYLTAQDRRRLRGLHREELYVRVDFPERLANPDQGPTGPHTHDHSVGHAALGKLGKYLRPEPRAVLLDVPLALELGRAEVAGVLAKFPGFGQGLVDGEVAVFDHVGA